jgi:hypothetical protein
VAAQKAATERRARFSYDDLLGYLIVELTSGFLIRLACRNMHNPIAGNRLWFDRQPAFQHCAGVALAKKSFFIAGLQNPAVLHHYADPPAEIHGPEQTLQGRGKHFGRPHFLAEFDEVLFFVAVILATHGW